MLARDFLRFLFDWQRVTPKARMQGPDAVPAVLGQLEGFDAPASAWETEVLPARIAEYDPAWLDEQCLAGRIVWTRLATRAGDAERGAAPVRSTPIALLARRNVRLWSVVRGASRRRRSSRPRRRKSLRSSRRTALRSSTRSSEGARLLPTQVEEALAELVALGIVNSDSFGGLRALLVPADRRRPNARDARRKRRIAIFGMQDAGRWALVEKGLAPAQNPSRSSIEASSTVRTLLRRWGVVFWKLLEREADWLPPWRQMLMCLRRLEARGEIRGGRFVAGFSGEQFALPDAVGLLRDARRKPNDGEFLSLSAADPLNLVGIMTPGARLPSLTGNRVLYRDGVPVAVYAGGEVSFLEQLDEKEQWQARNALLRRQVPGAALLLADSGLTDESRAKAAAHGCANGAGAGCAGATRLHQITSVASLAGFCFGASYSGCSLPDRPARLRLLVVVLRIAACDRAEAVHAGVHFARVAGVEDRADAVHGRVQRVLRMHDHAADAFDDHFGLVGDEPAEIAVTRAGHAHRELGEAALGKDVRRAGRADASIRRRRSRSGERRCRPRLPATPARGTLIFTVMRRRLLDMNQSRGLLSMNRVLWRTSVSTRSIEAARPSMTSDSGLPTVISRRAAPRMSMESNDVDLAALRAARAPVAAVVAVVAGAQQRCAGDDQQQSGSTIRISYDTSGTNDRPAADVPAARAVRIVRGSWGFLKQLPVSRRWSPVGARARAGPPCDGGHTPQPRPDPRRRSFVADV